MAEDNADLFDLLDEDGNPDPAAVQRIYEAARDWPPNQKVALLRYLKAASVRATIKTKYAHPAQIAAAIDPAYVITPAVDIISRAVERTIREKRRNLLVTMPPQEGKSYLCAVLAPIRALQLNPNTRVIVTTYGDDLATTHSRAMRSVVESYGSGVTDPLTGAEVEDRLGISLRRGANKIDAWSVTEGRGGVVAVGINAAITGRPADLLIIDDPYKNMLEADSKTYRAKVSAWMRSVAMTRLSPEASIILIQTRWHPDDLAGEVIEGERNLPPEQRTWRHINIPAIAEDDIPDALDREPGEPMQSARDTPEAKRDFEATRRTVGDRVFYALYQGAPAPPEGNMFRRDWFSRTRLPEAPANPLLTAVAIDPSESGQGDDAGVLGGMLTRTGQVVFTHDRSGTYTSDEWAREAVNLALEIGAREIAMEAFTAATTYERVIYEAWKSVRAEALAAALAKDPLTEAQRVAVRYARRPFTVKRWTKPGDAAARSTALMQAVQTGKAVTIEGEMAVLEGDAVGWQQGQHQPDRLAAAVILHNRLAVAGNQQTVFASPLDRQTTGPVPAWLSQRITGGGGAPAAAPRLR